MRLKILSNIRRGLIEDKSKFTESWTGPFEISKQSMISNIELEKIDNNKEELQNIKFLKLYVNTIC